MSMGNGRGRGVAVGALALVAAACSSGAEDGRNPMGSQTMVTSADHRALYVAVADEGIVARLDAEQGQVTELAVDGEPTRVARIGDRVLVSLRTNGSILELRDEAGTLSKVREVQVGTEPVGLVATEDGTRVYAAISTAGQVLELDGASLTTLRVWNVTGEPKWLGLHPGGEALYVAGTGNPGLFYIDLTTGASRAIGVPVPEGFSSRSKLVTLSMRTTGDPAVSPKGNLLAVPMMAVDNTTPFSESSTVTLPEPGDGYGGRMNPGMVLVPIDGEGVPKDEEARSVAISTFEVNGYPASALFSPDGELVVATIEGSAAIALFDPRQTSPDELPPSPRGSVLEPLAVDFIQTRAGPRAVAFTADRMASVFSFIDGVVTRIDVSDTKDQLEQGGSFIRRPGLSFQDVSVVSEPLPADVAAGRRLFYASNDTRMSSVDSGVSCATCHAEGRDDGLTWVFERGPRQTPSLAGVVSMRAPVRWEGDMATVADDAMATSQGLMGGNGLVRTDAQRIEAYIDFVRAVDHPGLYADPAQVARGKAIFERSDVGCAGCHSGPLYTDKARYDMYGFDGVKTPSLLGVATTAPYLHDGSSATLRDLLLRARDGSMGDTSSLSEAELEDLEVFIRSL